jgi:cold shock CspA family protein
MTERNRRGGSALLRWSEPERDETPRDEGNPMRGTMLWFNETEDFGFISSEDGERVLVRGSGFVEGRPQGRCGGRAVTFDVNADGPSRSAEQVVLVAELAPRRARLRHRGR